MRRAAAPTTENDALLVGNPDRTAALYRLTDRLYRARTMSEVYDAALDAITESLDSERASVLLFDSDNVMRFVAWRGLSDHYRAALEGHTPWKPGDRDPAPIFVPDIDRTTESQNVQDAIRSEGIRALAFVPLMAEGAVIGKFMTYYEDVRSFPEEERALALNIARQVGFSLERHRSERARQSAELELRNSEERFRAMSEVAPVMMWISDDKGACLHLNRMLREFWGVDAGRMDRFDWRDSMHPEDAPEIGHRMFEALTNRTEVQVKGRYRNTLGEYRLLQTHARPRFSGAGEFLGFVGVNTDVTERERAEAQRDLLFAELNHRVKNTLAVVQGIARQTFKASTTMEQAKEAFDGRLMALARAHDLLTRGRRDLASLGDLAAEVLHSRGMDKSRSRIAGPQVLLPPKQALSVAMALHELFTNAVKYGAFANDQGLLDLVWTFDNGRVVIVWSEKRGPAVSKPSHRGFGSVLLERTVADIGGEVTVDFDTSGITCRMTFPLAAESAMRTKPSSSNF